MLQLVWKEVSCFPLICETLKTDWYANDFTLRDMPTPLNVIRVVIRFLFCIFNSEVRRCLTPLQGRGDGGWGGLT